MRIRRTLFVLVSALPVAALGLGLSGCGESDTPSGDTSGGMQRYNLVSGGQTGVYYPTAMAISRLLKNVDPSLELTVQTSGGSVANARMLARKDADFAVLQNDIAAYARQGKLMFDGSPMPQILGVAALYPEHIQIVAMAKAGIQRVTDLKGKRVAIGAIGSGTEANAMQILAAYGVKESDLSRVERLKASGSRDYLQDRRVDAAFFTFGVGTAAIQELALRHEIVFVPVDGAARNKMMAELPFYREAVIPTGAYRKANAGKPAVPPTDVPTVTVMATLAARQGVPNDVVQKVLRGVFENLDEFRRTHSRLADVNKQDSLSNLTLPAHPGAKAFYEQ